MSTHAGNASDKKIIVEAIEFLKSSVTPEKRYIILLIVPSTVMIILKR